MMFQGLCAKLQHIQQLMNQKERYFDLLKIIKQKISRFYLFSYIVSFHLLTQGQQKKRHAKTQLSLYIYI